MCPRQRSKRVSFALTVILALLIAPQPASSQSDSWASGRPPKDERLKQPVTARILDEPLRGWVEHLGQETSVRLKVAPDYEDRAITVRVKAMPLGELMEAVASLYGDHWRRGQKKEDADYVLEVSLNRRSRQRAFHDTYQRTTLAGILREAGDIARNEHLRLDLLPEPERTYKRWEYDLTPRGKVVSLLGPEFINRLLSGETIIVPVAETTGALRDALTELVGQYAMPSIEGWKPQDQDAAWVVFSSWTYWRFPKVNGTIGVPQREILMDIGPPGTTIRTAGVTVGPNWLQEDLTKALAPLQRPEAPDPQERERKGADLLDRVLPADTKPEEVPNAERSEMLVAIADAADVNLVADSFIRRKLLTPLLGGRTVDEALSAVCDLWGSDWRVERSTILVRDRIWWLNEPDEPPATAVAAWMATFRTKGALELEDSAAFSALSYWQQWRVMLRIPQVNAAFNCWLRFYAGLDARQKEAIWSPEGLDLRTIPQAQRLRCFTGSARKDLQVHDEPLAKAMVSGEAVLKLREESRDGRPTAIFSFVPTGATGQSVNTIAVSLPFRVRPNSGAAGGAAAR